MTVRLLALTALLVGACSSPSKDAGDDAAAPAPLDPGIELGELRVSTTIGNVHSLEPGRYLIDSGEGDKSAIVLDGLTDITLDLTGVELRGQEPEVDLDRAVGYGIFIRGCAGVTIRGGLIGGYHACIVVESSSDITIDGTRFDGWYGARLRSTTYSEDLGDWLYPHLNDEGEWLENYGGAISCTDASGVTISGCRGRRGQNGILFTRVTDSKVYDNDFSFMSGWGIGMYRASRNTVSHNVFDYCVRGYSHDVYWRGQDSAAILMFESCCENIIARNSGTHSGDGLFLYAGHDLVDRSVPNATGSDDNIFFENDFRYSVANSFEGTFSRGNVLVRNRLSGSHQHGIWGGYSSEMVVVDNDISDTIGGAITIEHGQDCLIADNRIHGNEIGVELYWDPDPQFVDGPYGRVRSTASSGHWVLNNSFADNVRDLALRETTALVFHENRWVPGTRTAYFERISAESDPTLDERTVQRWLDALDGAFPSGNLTDVTLEAWTGRYPEELSKWRRWTPPDVPGSQVISAEARDEFRGGLETIVMGEWGPWDYRSGAPKPAVQKPGGILGDCTWSAAWFTWVPGESDPRTNEETWRALAAAPAVRDEVPTFVNPWATDAVKRALGNDHFGLLASTTLDLDTPGTFDLTVNSDDGIRVFVDGELLIEDWTHHAPKRDTRTLVLEAGTHAIRVEYFQIQGAAALTIDLRAAR